MSTQYAKRLGLPISQFGKSMNGIDQGYVLGNQTITSSGASAAAATLGAAEGEEVFAIFPVTTAVWVAFGVTPVAAVGSGHYCPPGVFSRFRVPVGHSLATIDA